MTAIFDKKAKKKATNVTINSDLLKKAKEYKLNISAQIEEKLEEVIKNLEAQKWQKENSQAIDDYNKRVEKNGVFSDGLRSF